jgi:hypothetical protein
MAQTGDNQALNVIARGLENFVNTTKDKTDMELAGYVLRDTKEVFIENTRPGDTCLLAFPSMVILPEIRVECFVAVLADRVIAAWRKGLVFKKTDSRVIPKHTIQKVSWAMVNRPGVTRGKSPMLTIITNNDRPIEFAMPKDKPAVADMVVAAIQSNTDSTYPY